MGTMYFAGYETITMSGLLELKDTTTVIADFGGHTAVVIITKMRRMEKQWSRTHL